MVRTPSDISIFFKYYDFLGVVKDSFIYWRESSDTIPYVRATSHTRLRAHDHSTSSTLIGRKKLEPVRVHFTLRLRDQRSMWMQDGCGCKVYMDSYMASNRSCFMVTWIVFKTHLLEVGLKHNWETMAPQMLTNRWFILLYHVRGPTWTEIHWNSIWLGPVTYGCTLHLRIHDHTTWFWRCLGTSFGHFIWDLTNSWSRLLARVWSGP